MWLQSVLLFLALVLVLEVSPRTIFESLALSLMVKFLALSFRNQGRYLVLADKSFILQGFCFQDTVIHLLVIVEFQLYFPVSLLKLFAVGQGVAWPALRTVDQLQAEMKASRKRQSQRGPGNRMVWHRVWMLSRLVWHFQFIETYYICTYVACVAW